MTVFVIIVACWILLSIPLSFLVARVFRAGRHADRPRRSGETHSPSHRNAA